MSSNFLDFLKKPAHQQNDVEKAYAAMELRQALNRVPSHIKNNPDLMRQLAHQILSNLPESKEQKEEQIVRMSPGTTTSLFD